MAHQEGYDLSNSGDVADSADDLQSGQGAHPEESDTGSGAPAQEKKFTTKRVVSGVISLAIVVWVFAVAIPKFASYGAMFEELKTVAFTGIVLLILATLLNVVAYSSLWSASLPA